LYWSIYQQYALHDFAKKKIKIFGDRKENVEMPGITIDNKTTP